ncbi:MAG: RNA methyltransferase [Propionibacteriaceae bacterium]|nr:RNA methyltransferase [Propionibacteriaceae bacterium]
MKHALRFGANVAEIYSDDKDRALGLAEGICPDLVPVLRERIQPMTATESKERSTQPIPTHVLGFAEPPQWKFESCLPTDQPTILLDDPRNSKNLGAVVRLGAAVGATGVLANGDVDFFNPMAVRGAAGLQWSIPCWSSETLVDDLQCVRTERGLTIVGLDADGEPFVPGDFTGPTVFAFGSERAGLSASVRALCDHIVSLPMEPQVSSLNLATSVSAVMYLRKYSTNSA